MKRYLEYKESGVEWIGDIPKDWNTVPLTKYLESIVDYRGRTPEKTGGGRFLVTAKNIRDGQIDYEISQEFTSEDEYQKIMTRGIPQIGDVLFTTEAPLGEVANVDDVSVALAQRIIKFRPKSNRLNPYFLKYWILSYSFQSDLHQHATGSTAQGIKASKLCFLKLNLPPLKEQTQIANFLDRKTGKIDELIRVKERKIELLREQRTALINQAVTKGLDPNVEMKPSGVEWIGEIPKHWDRLRCANLFEVKHIKKTSGEINLSVYRDYGVIKRDSRNDNYNRVSEDTSNYKLVEPGDFVFNKMKCWQGSLGISEYRGIVSPAYTVCKPKRPFHGKYLHYLLRSRSYIQEFNRLSYGVRSGQWELRFEDFKEIVVPYPPDREQTQIVNFLDRKTAHIDELIFEEQRSIELLKEYRQSLISEAVTGKIDVRSEV